MSDELWALTQTDQPQTSPFGEAARCGFLSRYDQQCLEQQETTRYFGATFKGETQDVDASASPEPWIASC